MAAPAARWSGPGKGAAACRPPVLPPDLDDLELDGLQDDDGWVERSVRGTAVAADAERVGFGRCAIVGVRFTGARFHRLELTDATLTDCDLAGAVLEESTFVRVALTRCRLDGADLGGATLTDVRFTDCQMEDLGLRLAKAERLVVEGGTATGLDLYRARVPGSTWHDVDLTGADLSGADLARARLHGSTIVDVRGAKALAGTVIDPDQVVPVGLARIGDSGIVVAPRD
ncbi:pentapeptide repeat-containing protein [Aquihabitans sp. G128]|uniref:pentapeptide repeat-containing protein n=1 Tax=Aquihabitans sp. G128 TaxID=2849779 RepID=UPI001C2483E5|nr:pentapeptide repeat-containing protein [Aquihabitans sp. G128]QXC59859.1 pentapeptide repeat-containing protein [Aquihabitans sp. G128]